MKNGNGKGRASKGKLPGRADGARYGVRRVEGMGVDEGIALNSLAAGRGTPEQARDARAAALRSNRHRVKQIRDLVRVAHEVSPGSRRLPHPERVIELGEEVSALQREAWGAALDGSENRWWPVPPLALALWRLRAMEHRAARVIRRASGFGGRNVV